MEYETRSGEGSHGTHVCFGFLPGFCCEGTYPALPHIQTACAGTSLLGGFATSEAWLIAARALEGVGAAIASPTALALVSTTFPEGPARNRAFGVYAAVAGAGSAIGLLLGGVLTDALSTCRGRTAATVSSFALAAALLGTFVLVEARSRQPLMPLRLFNRRSRWGSYLIMLSVGAALLPLFFFLTQFVQDVLGFSAIKAGFAFLPLSATIIIAAQAASRLVPRVGVRALIVPGALLLGGGLFWLSSITTDSTYLGLVLPAMITIAVGMGLLFVPVTLTAVSGVERRDAGFGSAMLNVQQQVGGTLGLAALVTVTATATSHNIEAQLARLGGALPAGPAAGNAGSSAIPPPVLSHALVHGWSVGFEVAALFAAAALVAAVLTLPGKTHLQLEQAGRQGVDRTPAASCEPAVAEC